VVRHPLRRPAEQIAYEVELARWQADAGQRVVLLQEGRGGTKSFDAEVDGVLVDYKRQTAAENVPNRFRNHIQNAITKAKVVAREAEVIVLMEQRLNGETAVLLARQALIRNDWDELIRAVTVVTKIRGRLEGVRLSRDQIIRNDDAIFSNLSGARR
jgi:hypothetical protein